MRAFRLRLAVTLLPAILAPVLLAAMAHAQFAPAADKVREAVVTVMVDQEKRLGAGFVVNPDGYVLTNYHVLQQAAGAKVKLVNGEELDATVVKAEPGRDLLLLKVERQHLPTVQFAASDKLKQGDEVAALGAPFGLSDTLTKGVVSATDRDIDGKKYIQIDAALNQGNSGGPIINQEGRVVGVATKAALKAENMGFAIPSNDAMTFLNEAGITFAAGLDAPPAEATTPVAPPAEGAPQPPAAGPMAPPPALPASPPGLLAQPWLWLAAAAVVAFLVALITASVVARSAARSVVGHGYAPAVPPTQAYAQPPAGTWQPPAPPPVAPPPPTAPLAAEDLSDIDIELR